MKLLILGISFALAFFPVGSTAETRCIKDSSGNISCRNADTYSPADLREIYGSGPEAYLQGRRQVEQSNQLQEQALRQLQLENQRSALANQYEAQNNALRLENQRLKNEALADKNAENRQRYGSERVPLSASQYDRLLRIGDEELNQIIAQGQKLSADPDPLAQARGQRLMQISRLAVELRQKR